MSNIAKLKKQAAELEQKKQFDKALAKYVQVLEEMDEHVEEADVALYNRVGDLLLRQGNVPDALGYYEKAVDLYADAGFFNNAIALCNKILRNAPGRSIIYYKLGKISAQKGFTNDAKQNFLEYAERMQRGGQLDEAFRALTEFADLCPDQDDIRLMLADQLVRENRKSEAIHQLQTLYEKYHVEGRANDARATIDRMKAIDPSIEPRRGASALTPKAGDLVFLDLQYSNPVPGRTDQDAEPASRIDSERPLTIADDLAFVSSDISVDAVPLAGIEHGAALSDDLLEATFGGDLPLVNPGPVSFEREDDAQDVMEMIGLEPTSHSNTDTHLDSVELGNEFQVADGSITFESELEPWNGDDLPLILPDDPLPHSAPEPRSQYLEDEPGITVPSLDWLDSSEDLDLTTSFSGIVTPVESFALDKKTPSSAFELDSLEGPKVSRPVTAAHALPLIAATRSDAVMDRILDEPRNWLLHRQAGEALLEEGAREHGMHELDVSMAGFEEDGNLVEARAVVDEILRLEPDSVRHHQKRVEYAFRTNDRGRLVMAYIELADSLLRTGDLDKARAVYERVLLLAPDDARAREALEATSPAASMPDPSMVAEDIPSVATEPSPRVTAKAPTPSPAVTAVAAPAPSPAVKAVAAPEPPPRASSTSTAKPSREPMAAVPSEAYVNLADWLREEETPKSTRMVAEGISEPADNQQADFAEMLERFKQGVAANIDESDHQSHFDLGIAYREMGLVDEAIAQFQKALRGPGHRVRTYEALGQCFVDKKQFQIASTLLSRAVADHSQSDENLVGVLYLRGFALEQLQRWDEARQCYERVFAVDIQFKDIGERLAALDRVAR